MNDDEADDDGHAQEMDQTSPLKTAEQGHEAAELNRLPDRQPRDDLRNAGRYDNNIEELLYGIIRRYVFVLDLEVQWVPDGFYDFGRPDRQ